MCRLALQSGWAGIHQSCPQSAPGRTEAFGKHRESGDRLKLGSEQPFRLDFALPKSVGDLASRPARDGRAGPDHMILGASGRGSGGTKGAHGPGRPPVTTEPSTTIENGRRERRRGSTSAPAAPTKSASVIKLLLRARGVTSLELIAATSWQPHSVRAFLSGLRKQGRLIVREARKSGEFAYRIETALHEPAPMPAPLADQSEG